MTFQEDVGNVTRQLICGAISDLPSFPGWLDSLIGAPGAPALGLGGGRAAGQFALGLFCDRVPEPVPDGGFSGGQCNLAPYLFEYGYTDSEGRDVEQTLDFLLGPIGRIERTVLPNGNIRLQVPCRGAGNNPQPPGFKFTLISNFPPPVTNERVISVTRKDGQPDDCGDLPPDQQPPPPRGDRTFPINIGPFNGDVIIGLPNLTVAGNIIIPVEINNPDFNVTGVVNLNTGDINFNFGGADPDGSSCCLPEEEIDVEPPPEQDPPPEENEDDTIVGVLVTTTAINLSNVATIIAQEDNPDIYAPNVGYVNFRVKIGEVYGWTEDLPVKNTRHYIPCPAGAIATDVAGTPRPGVAWTLTPVKSTGGKLVTN